MTNEIKEILDEINKYPYGAFYGLKQKQVYQVKQLLDYITNLQQIEEQHKKLNGELREENKKLNNKIKDIGKELEILCEINNIDIIKVQLLNMKYRIKGDDENGN